ncbi:MAG: PIN domain-containing protein [archaeon]|nr:PIN domain-containing protein [archaeon]
MTEDEPKLVDSNLLIYAYDKGAGQKHILAKELLKERWLKQDGFLSVQNLAEFYHVTTRKINNKVKPEQAKQIILDLTQGFSIIRYNENTIINAVNNQLAYKIEFWDSLIVSAMEENGISTIITENEKDFKKIKWLKVINPFK